MQSSHETPAKGLFVSALFVVVLCCLHACFGSLELLCVCCCCHVSNDQAHNDDWSLKCIYGYTSVSQSVWLSTCHFSLRSLSLSLYINRHHAFPILHDGRFNAILLSLLLLLLLLFIHSIDRRHNLMPPHWLKRSQKHARTQNASHSGISASVLRHTRIHTPTTFWWRGKERCIRYRCAVRTIEDWALVNSWMFIYMLND